LPLPLKQRVPIGLSPKIPIEVKTKRASGKDAIQLRGYMDELKNECPAGLLVASDFAKQAVALAPASRIRLVRYNIALNLRMSPTFDDICDALSLEPM